MQQLKILKPFKLRLLTSQGTALKFMNVIGPFAKKT